jgi:alpha-amylase
VALLDHFHGWNSAIREFRDATLADYGTFLQEPYEIAEIFTDGVTLRRVGVVGGTDVEVNKTIRAVPGKPILNIHYRIRNLAAHDLHSPFGIEWNLSLQAPNSEQHYLTIPDTGEQRRPLNETRESANVRELYLADEHEGVAAHFSFASPIKLWRAPIETVSLSESGFEKIFQSIALLFQWELHLGPHQEWQQQFTATLSEA